MALELLSLLYTFELYQAIIRLRAIVQSLIGATTTKTKIQLNDERNLKVLSFWSEAYCIVDLLFTFWRNLIFMCEK